jgi:hypothetical protein
LAGLPKVKSPARATPGERNWIACLKLRSRNPIGWCWISQQADHTVLKFAPFAERVVACDISSKMLTALRTFISRPNTEKVALVTTATESLPYKENKFDLVTYRIAPHHFSLVSAILIFGFSLF